jgi:hypothetical protein
VLFESDELELELESEELDSDELEPEELSLLPFDPPPLRLP